MSNLITRGKKNLIAWSNTFSNAYWFCHGDIVTTPNSGTGPRGGNDAWLLSSVAGGYANRLYPAAGFGIRGDGTYSFNLFAKTGSYNLLILRIYNATKGAFLINLVFDTDTGVPIITTADGATMLPGGDDWWRCNAYADGYDADDLIYPMIHLNGAGNMLIWNAQMNPGAVEDDIVETKEVPISH